MDDPLKDKTFQNPQGETPAQGGEPQVQDQPTRPQSPVFQAPTETPLPDPTFQPMPKQEATEPQIQFQPSQEVPPASPSAPKFSIGNILKLLIGLAAISIIGFLIFGVVLPSVNKKPEKIELTLWDTSDTSTINNALPDFEKQNPTIKVNVVKQDIKDYKDRLVTRIKNGSGPDIFRFHNTWVLQLSDVLLPVPSDVITKNAFDNKYYSVVKHDLINNGAIYGIPLEIDTLSLFVNSAMLKDAKVIPPTNWNDFITAARALTLKDQSGKIKTAGAGIGTFDNVTHAPDIMSLLFAQDSVNLDDISQTKSRVSDALNFYTGFSLSDGSVWDSTLDPTILAFSKGNLAMYFGYYKDSAAIKSANTGLSFDILSVPHLTGQDQTITSYYPIGVSLRSKHQKEALMFLKYLSQKPMIDSSKGQAKDSVSSYFAGETFDNGLNTQLNTQLATAISSILSGGNSDSAADNLILGFSQVLNQFKPTQ